MAFDQFQVCSGNIIYTSPDQIYSAEKRKETKNGGQVSAKRRKVRVQKIIVSSNRCGCLDFRVENTCILRSYLSSLRFSKGSSFVFCST